MILIADSGSTKTDWLLLQENGQKIFVTPGYNPYFVDIAFVKNSVQKEIAPFISENLIKKIYFYGAGCMHEQKKQIINEALEEVFINANIEVHHDLLGAARALFGREEGIACILGTGSNSCYYNGNDIEENAISLGYIFGDEGAGVHLGKSLLKSYMKDELSPFLKQKILEKYNITVFDILDNVYKKPFPNRYIASFSYFLAENIEHEEIRNIVMNCFRDFFNYQLKQYSTFGKANLSAVGSICSVFEKELKSVAIEYGTQFTNIYKSPIQGLFKYHSQNN